MTFHWKAGQSPTQVFAPAMERLARRLESGIELILELYAVDIEATMKEDAPWTDQTANARQTLQAFVYKKDDGVLALVAKQQMDYGLWLELKNGGKFAIVIPTLEQYYGEVWGAIKDAVQP